MNERPSKSELNSSACEELRTLLPAYVVGAADADEVARIQTLLKACPEARSEIADYAAISAGFYERIEPVAPPPDLYNRLIAQVHDQNRAPIPSVRRTDRPSAVPRAARRATLWVLAAAAALLLIFTNVYWLNRLDGLQSQLAALREQRDQVISLATANDVRRTSLVSTQPDSDLTIAMLLWDTRSPTAVLTGVNLPLLSSERTYQLWLVVEEQPVSAGVFELDENGIATLRFTALQPIQQYEAAAISVEPLGGSLAPTTQPIALGMIETL